MVKVVLAVLLKVPWTLVVPAMLVTEVRTGKFCRLLAPESPSPASFGGDVVGSEVDSEAGI
jgi:hypothetical protein